MEKLNCENIGTKLSSLNFESERNNVSGKVLDSLNDKMESAFYYLKVGEIGKKFMENSKKVLNGEFILDYDNILSDMKKSLYDRFGILEYDLLDKNLVSSEDCNYYPYPVY